MSDQTRYPQVLRAVTETPWAIRAEKLVVIRELIAMRASGQKFTDEQIHARIGAGPAGRQAAATGTVAIIPIYGVIIPKADLFSEMSGGTSVQSLSDSLRAAVADPAIDSILLDVDSPGGMTDLVPELAAQIREARGVKPVVAIANTDAASAAYWLAAQADEFVVTPSGMVGSIGVFAAHEDISAQQQEDGVKTTLISAGKYKVESNPFAPLSDDARAAIQARVNSFYEMFVADVALGRGVSASDVKAGFGEGRVVTAADALGLGMVDRIDTFEATVERMIGDAMTSKGTRSISATSNVVTSANGAITTWAHPPDHFFTNQTIQAPIGSLSFAQAADASRHAPEQLVTDAKALRVLTPVKRDELAACAKSWRASADAADELAATSDPDPGADVLVRGLLAGARRRHTFLNANGAPA